MDIRSISSQFGVVNRVLFLSKKQQAFVEFMTFEEATLMLAHTQAQPIRLGTRTVIAQYSNKQEITIPVRPPTSGPTGSGPDGRILLVTVSDVQFPVTLEVIYQVFGMCGTITKIVVFNKAGKDQALVQFERAEDAAQAMERFQGKNIYSGCNTLTIQYSNLPDVTIKGNTDRSYDFTNPGLPSGNPAGDALLAARYPKSPGQPAFGGYGGGALGGGGGFGMDMLGGQGMPPAGGFGAPTPPSPMMQQFPFGMGGGGGQAGRGVKRVHDAISSGEGLDNGRSPVVLVNNLHAERTTPDAIFNLFSTCGLVLRVKILFAKRDSALVQFETPDQAERARVALSGCPLWGHHLMVFPSKHPSIQPHRDNAGDGENSAAAAKLYADYAASNLHRFRGPASQGRSVPMAMPSRTLHVSNVPDMMNEEALAIMFQEFGPVTKVKFLPSKADPSRAGTPRKMALVELPSVEKGAEAICLLHNHMVDQARLRISFSTSTNSGQGQQQ